MTSANEAYQPFSITPVTSPQDFTDLSHLFTAYARSLNIDLSFQDFTTELASLPGKYQTPSGCLLLARNTDSNQAIGCVGLRPLGKQGVCELKRLYVSPQGRGSGLGKALVQIVIARAKEMGYEVMRLDTLGGMVAARGLYTKLGFVEREAYYETPIEETVFFELDLRSV